MHVTLDQGHRGQFRPDGLFCLHLASNRLWAVAIPGRLTAPTALSQTNGQFGPVEWKWLIDASRGRSGKCVRLAGVRGREPGAGARGSSGLSQLPEAILVSKPCPPRLFSPARPAFGLSLKPHSLSRNDDSTSSLLFSNRPLASRPARSFWPPSVSGASSYLKQRQFDPRQSK
ncbi:unnamed protein product [Protopolystoma xenopodis]|uniref:Uncharacterized protein n=1 Tax=Protopolystoma xenopodis TaxID=117903 RepID=A0A3S5AGK9_9PLAT|nr:unnamed protein product [Protopolystoma xenopodis]